MLTSSVLPCRYEVAKKKGDYDEEQMKRENAKQALERYMHYYQRWAENDKARLQVAPQPVETEGTAAPVKSKHGPAALQPTNAFLSWAAGFKEQTAVCLSHGLSAYMHAHAAQDTRLIINMVSCLSSTPLTPASTSLHSSCAQSQPFEHLQGLGEL